MLPAGPFGRVSGPRGTPRAPSGPSTQAGPPAVRHHRPGRPRRPAAAAGRSPCRLSWRRAAEMTTLRMTRHTRS